ncbi:MAG: HAMP domain-containing histidine kinase [Acidobacteriota bacterium]|nr:HAMP domain-containing histidine kinase [Acidobacteriota bacterium]
MTASLWSTDSSTPPEGLALVCDAEGAVQRVAATLEGAPITESLDTSVDRSSRDACAVFLHSVKRSGFARSMPLRIGSRDVHCFALLQEAQMTVVGVIDPSIAGAFAKSIENFDALADEIRRTHSTYVLYEELAHLNNELVTAQRELARTVAELERLNKFKDELLGMAAHDLRNPLNVNAAFITFLIEDGEHLSDDNHLLLDRLRTNSQYMLRLVDSVLDFSAINAGHVRLQLEESSIEDLVREVVETMRILADAKQVELRLSVEGKLPQLKLDRVKMSQAVQNLISNAVQYSPSGTRIDVRLRAIDSGVELEVEDRGPGIPESELPDLFKPFTRLSTVRLSKQRSVGLGLAITRRLVEAHGGTISVRSEVGHGSTFTVRL